MDSWMAGNANVKRPILPFSLLLSPSFFLFLCCESQMCSTAQRQYRVAAEREGRSCKIEDKHDLEDWAPGGPPRLRVLGRAAVGPGPSIAAAAAVAMATMSADITLAMPLLTVAVAAGAERGAELRVLGLEGAELVDGHAVGERGLAGELVLMTDGSRPGHDGP